ncbi:MAG TPA: glycosyltransferase family 61 protein [Pyrinomonadaceae bacterium]|nr:glycosyltransferase family 61 protein [Pyrinomonadaceae bacterium]
MRIFRPFETPRDGARVLSAGRVSRRRLPLNFKEEDLPLFAHELEREIPPTLLLELEGVGVNAEGMLFKGGRILPESFSSPVIMGQFMARRRSVLKALAVNRLRRAQRRVERDCLWVVDDWSYGYFHWLADALCRLYAARDEAESLVLLLPRQYRRLEYVRSSLKAFRTGGVEYVGDGELVFPRRLFMPTHVAPSGNYNEEIVRGLSELLVGFYGEGQGSNFGERIYLSRGRAPKRKVTNEDELLGTLREFDFRVVHFEEHPFDEQVRIAAGARCLVSNHGAGLTNMMFMKPGGRVLELRRRDESERNWFFNLASATGLGYFYQLCDPEHPGEDPHTANLVADPQLFRENVRSMLAD